MFAGGDDSEGRFLSVGDYRYVEMHGYDPIPVTVHEDDEGVYFGWIGSKFLHYEAATEPCMIQPRRVLFDMQFPYGPEASAERGQGRIVRLTIIPKNPR